MHRRRCKEVVHDDVIVVTPLVQLFSPKLTDKAITRVVTKILSLAIRPKSAHSLSLVLR